MIGRAIVPTKTYKDIGEYKAAKSLENEAYEADVMAKRGEWEQQQAQQKQVELETMQKTNKEIPIEILNKIQNASQTDRGEYTSPGSEFSPRNIVQDLPGEEEGVNPLLQRDIGRERLQEKFGETSIPNKAEFEVFSLEGDKITNDYDPTIMDRSTQVISAMGASSAQAMMGIAALLEIGDVSTRAGRYENSQELTEDQIKENIYSKEILVRNNTSGKIERKTYGDLASGANKLAQGLIESLPENVLIAIAAMYTGGVAGPAAAGVLSGSYYGVKTTAAEYVTLRAEGYNKTTAFRAALAQGGAQAVLEGVSGAATGKIGKLGTRPGVNTVAEAGTEAAQELASNLIDQSIGKDVGTFDGVAEAGLMGGISSQIIKGILGPIGKARIKSRLTRSIKGKDPQVIEMAQDNPELMKATLVSDYELSSKDADYYVDAIVKANPKEEVVAKEEVVKSDVDEKTQVTPEEEVEVSNVPVADDFYSEGQIAPTSTKPHVVDDVVVEAESTKSKPSRKKKKKKSSNIKNVLVDSKGTSESGRSESEVKSDLVQLEEHINNPEFKEVAKLLKAHTKLNKIPRVLIKGTNHIQNYGKLQSLIAELESIKQSSSSSTTATKTRTGSVGGRSVSSGSSLVSKLKKQGSITSGSFTLNYDGTNVSIRPKGDNKSIPAFIPTSMLMEMREDESIGTLYNDEIKADARYFPKTKQLEQSLGGTPITTAAKQAISYINNLAKIKKLSNRGELSSTAIAKLDKMSDLQLAQLITSSHEDNRYTTSDVASIMNYSNKRRGRFYGIKPSSVKRSVDKKTNTPPSVIKKRNVGASTEIIVVEESVADVAKRHAISTPVGRRGAAAWDNQAVDFGKWEEHYTKDNPHIPVFKNTKTGEIKTAKELKLLLLREEQDQDKDADDDDSAGSSSVVDTPSKKSNPANQINSENMFRESDSDIETRTNMNTSVKQTERVVDSAIKAKDGQSIRQVLDNLVELTKHRLYNYNSNVGKSVRRVYSKIRHVSRQLGDKFSGVVNSYVFNPKNGIVTAFVPEGSGIDGSVTPTVLKTIGDPITGVKVIDEGESLVNPYSTELDNIDYESVLSDEGLSPHNRTTIIGLMNIKENSGLDIRVHNDEYMDNFSMHIKELSDALNDVVDGDYNGAITEVTDSFKQQEVSTQREFINDVITENKDKGESIVAKGEKAWSFIGATSAKFNSPHHLFGIMGSEYKSKTFDKYHTATNKYLYIKNKLGTTLNDVARDPKTVAEFKKYGSMNLHDIVQGDIVNSNTNESYKDGDLVLTFDDLLSLYNFDAVQHINSDGLYNFRFPSTKERVVSINTMQLLDIMDKVEDVLKTNPNLKAYSKILTEVNANATKTHNQYETVRKLDATEKVGLLQGDYPMKVINKVTGVGKSRHSKASSEQAKSMRNNYTFDTIAPENRLFVVEPSSISTNNFIERVARISAYEDVISEIGGYMEDAELKKASTDRMGNEGFVELKGWYDKLNSWYNGSINVSQSQQWYKELAQMLKSSFVRTNLTANPYVVAKQAASVEMGAVAFSNIADIPIVKVNLQLAKNTSLSTIRRTGVGVTNLKNVVTSKSTENNYTRTNDFITDWYNEYAPQIQQRMENNGSYEMREIRENKKKGKGGIGAPLSKSELAKKYTIGLGSDVSDTGMKGITAVDMSVMDGLFITSLQTTRDSYRSSQKLVPTQINNLINNLASGATVPGSVLTQTDAYMDAHDEASIEFFNDTAKLLDEVVIVSQPAIERHIGVGARDADGVFSWATMFGSQRTVTHAYTMELADNVYQKFVNGDLDKDGALKEMLKLILVGLIGGGVVIGAIDESRDALENSTSAALRDPKSMVDRTVSSIAGNNYVTGIGYRLLEASTSEDRQYNANAVLDLTVPHLEPLVNLGKSLTDVATKGAGSTELAELAGVAGTIPTGLPIARAMKYINLITQEESLLSGAMNIAKIDLESDPIKRQDLVVEYIQELYKNEDNPAKEKKLKYQLAQAKGKRTRLKRKK